MSTTIKQKYIALMIVVLFLLFYSVHKVMSAVSKENSIYLKWDIVKTEF